MTFGQWIRHLRRQQFPKMSQQVLAEAIHVSKGYVSQIETDNSASTGLPPRVADRHLRGLAKVLGVPEQEMFSRATAVVPDGFNIVNGDGAAYSPAAALVREKLAQCEECVGIDFPQPQIDILVDEIEDYARHRLSRTARHLRSERQKQEAA